MSYNRRNYLHIVAEVQAEAIRARASGLSYTRLFRDVISPRYHISRSTFYNYLGVNVRKELRALGEFVPNARTRVSRSKSRI